MKRFILFPLLVCMMAAGTVSARADETGMMDVDITTYDNEKVLIMNGHTYYSAIPVTFTPKAEGEKSYSISIDDGVSFGSYIKMDSESVTLYPDDDTSPSGRWMIRFMSCKEGEETEGKEDAEGGGGDEDAEGGGGNEDTEDGEGNEDAEGGSVSRGSVVCSDTYSICFDVEPPSVRLPDPGCITDWLDSERTIELTLSDNTGISRVVSRCRNDVINEVIEKEGEEVVSCTVPLVLRDTGEPENTVETVCYDVAGNSSVMTFTYMYDDKPPVVSAAGVGSNAVLSSDVRLTVLADDGDNDAFISYSLERKTRDEIITKEAQDISGCAVIDVTEDGAYTLTARAYDRAGNTSSLIKRQFVIDTNAPVIGINGTGNGADLRSAAKISFDVEDDRETDTEVNITLKRTALGNTEIIPIEPYNTLSTYDSREVYINSDGEYEATLRAVDAAGNKSLVTKRFRIDTNAPDISISGINEGAVTGKKPVVRFSAGEMFYDATIMTTALEKREAGGYRLISSDDHVMRSIRDHMDVAVDSEGEYRLTCTAADRSGNRKESSVSFTVDYTPPVIAGLSGLDRSFFRSFSLKKKISEFVSDSTRTVANAYVNDVPYSDGQEIIKEGKYVLTILAKDEADNESEGSAVFIVDHTSPQIVLEGFDSEGNIQKGSRVKVSLADEEDSLLSVALNGKNIPVDASGSAGFTVDESGSLCISVKATDPAGNMTDTDIHTMCMMGAFIPRIAVKEISVPGSAGKTDEEDIPEPLGLSIGLLSVLSGSFGFVYRTFLRD